MAPQPIAEPSFNIGPLTDDYSGARFGEELGPQVGPDETGPDGVASPEHDPGFGPDTSGPDGSPGPSPSPDADTSSSASPDTGGGYGYGNTSGGGNNGISGPDTSTSSPDESPNGTPSEDDDSNTGGSRDTGSDESPIQLDLSGRGLSVTQLNQSNTFEAINSDGYQHRTAWAAAGEAVLFVDPNGLNTIRDADQYVFTDWDPSAKSDMDALRNVFDTNHDGKLDAGDAAFGQFKLMVTNADGTTTVETLAQAGITSIDLTQSAVDQTFADGSSIDGEATFTRTDGTTGAVGSMTYAAEAQGYAVQNTTTINDDGSTTVDNRALNADGSLNSDIASNTSADGTTRTVSYDDRGTGVIDRTQTITDTVNADGGRVETVADYDGDGQLRDSTTTTTAADGSTYIKRDTTGGINPDGTQVTDQTETRRVLTDGPYKGDTADTVADVSADGTVLDSTFTQIGADGLGRDVQVDHSGAGHYDHSTVYRTTFAPDGTRTDTVIGINHDQSHTDSTTIVTSADHATRTTSISFDGDAVEQVRVDQTGSDGAGGAVTTTTVYNGDQSQELSGTVTSVTADGLTKTTQMDMDGDGAADRIVTDSTAPDGKGGETEDVSTTSADGTLLGRVASSHGADGVSHGTATLDGEGYILSSDTITVGPQGSTKEVAYTAARDETILSQTERFTSSDGLSTTTRTDHSGDGTFDRTVYDVTYENSDGAGGSLETVTTVSANGKLLNRTNISTSADGASTTTQIDSTGALDSGGSAVFDRTTLDYVTYAADNSRIRTQAAKSQDGTVLSEVVTDYSPDRQSHSITTDANGDGHTTTLEQVTTQANGDVVDSIADYNYDVSLVDAAVRTTSGNGLHVTTQIDAAGTGHYNRTIQDDTAIDDSGLRTETVVSTGEDGTVVGETVTTSQANGDLTTVSTDTAGDGTFDRVTSTARSFNADGGTTVTVTDSAADGTVRDSTTTITSGNGLSTEVDRDLDGDGTVDMVTATLIAYATNGDITTTRYDAAGSDGTLYDQSTTTVSGDGRTTQTNASYYGTNFGSMVDYSTVDAKTVGDDGSRYDDALIYDASGTLVRETLTTAQGNGLGTVVQVDVNGDGTFDTEMDDTVALDDDGGRTETTTMSGSAGMDSQTVTRTSGNGLSKTVRSDAAGDGTVDTVTQDDTTLNANGSRHEAYAQTNADGSLRDSTTVDTSADGKHVTVARVLGTDGSQAETIDRGTDGTVTDTLSDRDGSNAALGGETVTTSANGLVKVVTYRDAGGNVTDVQSDTRTLGTDGSTTEVFSDQDSAGGVNAAYTTTTAGNGLERHTQARFNGFLNDYDVDDYTYSVNDGSADEGSVDNDVVVSNTDGSERDERFSTVSADALQTSSATDEDGDGNFDIVSYGTKFTDGTASTSTTIYNSDTHAQDRQDTVITSADGRTTTLFSARDGDTTARYKEQTVENADGTYGDKSQFTSGTWAPSWTQIRGQAFDTTGGQTVTIGDYDGTGGLEDSIRTTTSGNGLSKQSYLDTDGNGQDDTLRSDATTIGGGGDRTELVSSGAAPGSANAGTMAYGRKITTSADGLSVTTATDDDGNGVYEKVETSVRGIDGTLSDTVTFYDNTTGQQVDAQAPDGSTGDAIRKTTSADGLIVTTSEGDLATTKTYVASSNDSYVWSGTAQGQPLAQTASHNVDANGIDTWTSTYSHSAQSTDGVDTTTIRISTAEEQTAIAEANAVYQTVLDRPMNDFEREALIRYVDGGILDQHALAVSLIQTSGAPSDADAAVKGYYDNDYGHDPSAADMATYVQHASGGGGSVDTYADVAVAIAEKAVNEQAGNGLLALLPNAPQATAMTVTLIPPDTAAMTNTGQNYAAFTNTIGKPSGNLTPGQISQFGTLVGDPNAASAPQVDFASASSSTSGQGTAVPGFFSQNGNSATAPSGGAAGPLVVNLAGGRVHTTDLATSAVRFDDTGSGTASATAWTTADEGFLVLDPQSAQVTSGSAMVPTFAALARYDANGDGVLTAAEADKAGVKIWVDANGDGVDQKGEVESLGQAGIASIDLKDVAQTGSYDHGNVIAADTSVSFSNGTAGDAADAWLAYGGALAQGATYQFGDDVVTRAADGTASELLYGQGKTVDAGATGLTTVVDAGSNNVLQAGSAAKATLSGAAGDRLVGGSGDDTLLAIGDGEAVTTGTGTNAVYASGANVAVDASRGTSRISLDGANDSVTGATASTAVDVTKGTGARVAATGSKVTVEGGVGAEISGSNVAVTAAGQSSITLDASNSTLASDAASTVALNGSNDALTLDRGSKVSIAGTGETVAVSSGTLSLAANAAARVTGNGDFATQAAGSSLAMSGMEDGVEVTGAGAATALSGGSVMLADGSSDALTGTDDEVVQGKGTALSVAGTGASLVVTGTGNQSTLSDARITVQTGASTQVTGSRDTIAAGPTGLSGTLTGDDDRVTIAGTGGQLSLSGLRDAVAMDQGTLALADAASATLAGSGDTATLGKGATLAVTGSVDHVTEAGDGGVLTVAGDGTVATANGAGDTMTLTGASVSAIAHGANAVVKVTGQNSAIYVDGSNDAVTYSGTGATISAKNSSTVTLADGSTATVDGNFNTVSIGTGTGVVLKGTGDALTASGGGDFVVLSSSGESVSASAATVNLAKQIGVSVSGNGDQIGVDNGDTLTLSGNSDAITVNGDGNSLAVSGTGDTVTETGRKNNAVTLGKGSTTVTAGGVSVVQTADGNLAVHGGLASSAVTASSNSPPSIALGNGDTVSSSATPAKIDGYAASGLHSWEELFSTMSGALQEVDQYQYNASNALMEIDRYNASNVKTRADLYDPQTSAEIGSYLYGSNGHVNEVVDMLHNHDWLSQSDGTYKDKTTGAVSKTQPTLR